MTVPDGPDVDTAMGNSSVLRTAFKSGRNLPPDDTVSSTSLKTLMCV